MLIGSRRARAVAGATLAVVALAVAGWFVLSAQRAGDIHVLLPPDAFSCDGTRVGVTTVPAIPGDDLAAPVASITEGMRCTLDIRIENRSSSDVTVQQVFLPVLGPQGGPGVRAVGLDGVALEPREGEVDAIFDFEQPYPILAGSAAVFTTLLEWRPDGCTSKGGTISFPDQPTVTVSVLRRLHDRSFVGTGFGFRGTDLTQCT